MDLCPLPLLETKEKSRRKKKSENKVQVHQTNSRAVSLKILGTHMPITGYGAHVIRTVSGFTHPDHHHVGTGKHKILG